MHIEPFRIHIDDSVLAESSRASGAGPFPEPSARRRVELWREHHLPA